MKERLWNHSSLLAEAALEPSMTDAFQPVIKSMASRLGHRDVCEGSESWGMSCKWQIGSFGIFIIFQCNNIIELHLRAGIPLPR